MNETATSTASTVRQDIRRELDDTRTAYHELVRGLNDSQWNAPSGNPGWTCGQLAWHIAETGKFVSGLVANARKGKGTNPPGFLLPLAFKANEFLVRRKSRNATRDSVIADFDANVARLTSELDSVQDDQFTMSATNFGEKRTIRQMFSIVTEHFGEHGPQIRNAP